MRDERFNMIMANVLGECRDQREADIILSSLSRDDVNDLMNYLVSMKR